jgi:hypothetical protein
MGILGSLECQISHSGKREAQETQTTNVRQMKEELARAIGPGFREYTNVGQSIR